jgi:hypothetical protein
MLVEPGHIASASQEVAARGGEEALAEVGKMEPALASFIQQSLACVAGQLALAGAPTPVVQGSHQDVLSVVLTCIQALRRGHYELWKDALVGTPLAQIDPALRLKPRRRKGRPEEGGNEK